MENLEIEIQILKSLVHPHIVGLIDCQQSSNYFHIIMEYCSLGDLSYFIRKRQQLIKAHPLVNLLLMKYPSPENSSGLSNIITVHFLKQLASALKFLRSKNLVHRDIKPQNLLLCYPTHSKKEFLDREYTGNYDLPVLKIADFGFARFLPSQTLAETLCGSPLYMAPEILRYEKYNAKADLWSVGAVLYEMTIGKPPFRANNHVELLKKIENARDNISFPENVEVDPDIKRVICGLLKLKSIERMSFNEFFNDRLILSDLSEYINDTQELDHSSIDENLFISEYLSKNERFDRPNPIKIEPIAVIKEPVEEEKVLSEAETGAGSNEKEPTDVDTKLQSTNPAKLNSNSSLSSSKGKSKVTDLLNERDYVVVEKKSVEVNALADELAKIGVNDRKSPKENNPRGSLTSHKRPSFGISLSSTGNLNKAIGQLHAKLLGHSKEVVSTYASPVSVSPTIGQYNVASEPDGHEVSDTLSNLIVVLESLAAKSHAVNLFAQVKYSQLIPFTPSSTSAIADDSDDEDNNILGEEITHLSPISIKSIAEEGLALYIKTLSLLARSMNLTSEWWYSNEDGLYKAGVGELYSPPGLSSNSALTAKLNSLVQWIRQLFNECLERADFIRLKLNEANQKLGLLNGPDGGFELNTKVIAEKLIFDRALEISRNAAVSELVGEDLHGCELAYSTSIWMLEAILDSSDPSAINYVNGAHQYTVHSPERLSEDVNLDVEDRAMVQKFINSIGNRLNILRKKIEQAGENHKQ